jgi:hypothetical protein
MSSDMRIIKVCEYCKQEFIARKTTSQTCSDPCAKRLYKLRQVKVIQAKEWLTLKEAALLLNVSPLTLSPAEFKRLEQKVNLLNDKIDRIMEVQGIELVKAPDLVQKEEEKKRKARERQQAKLLRKEQFKKELDQMMADRRLVTWEGGKLMHQFNLVQPPSAARIREYQRTNDPRAFDGLKRKS